MATVIGADVIVCYLTGEPPDLADQAAGVIDDDEDLLVPLVAIAEAGRLLVEIHRYPLSVVAEALMDLLQKANISVHGAEPDDVLQALLMCKTTDDLSFADAMVWASAKSAAAKVLSQLAQIG